MKASCSLVQINNVSAMLGLIIHEICEIEEVQKQENRNRVGTFLADYHNRFWYRWWNFGMMEAFIQKRKGWAENKEDFAVAKLTQLATLTGEWKSTHQTRRLRLLWKLQLFMGIAEKEQGEVFLSADDLQAIYRNEEIVS